MIYDCNCIHPTRNILDCDQSTPRALFSSIFLQSCCHVNGSDNVFQRGLYSFEIFQDDVRPPLKFGSTGSRSTQYANPENYISNKHVDSALFANAILKLSQLKAAVLFPASKLYSLGTVGYLPIQNLAPMSYASTVM